MGSLHVSDFVEELFTSLSPGNWLPPFIESGGQQVRVFEPVGRRRVLLTPPLLLVGIGKSAPAMAEAALASLNVSLVGGFIASSECRGKIEGIECAVAPHPLPDERSVESAERIIEMLEGHCGDTLFLISGGGSSAVELPIQGIDISGIRNITAHLLNVGADIKEINLVRRSLSAVKGGGLLKWVKGRWASLIASDLYDDSLQDISSGPTVHTHERRVQALRVIERYGLEKLVPGISRIVAETPPHKTPGALKRGANILALSMREGARSAMRLLRTNEIDTHLMEEPSTGPVEEGVKELILRGRATPGESVALVGWGELSVKVKGSGLGGRCSEAALRALKHLRGDETFMAIATDGRDGNSPGAGGWVSVEDRSALQGAVERYLEESDSYTALKEMGRTIYAPEEGTNVADIYIYFRGVRLRG